MCITVSTVEDYEEKGAEKGNNNIFMCSMKLLQSVTFKIGHLHFNFQLIVDGSNNGMGGYTVNNTLHKMIKYIFLFLPNKNKHKANYPIYTPYTLIFGKTVHHIVIP